MKGNLTRHLADVLAISSWSDKALRYIWRIRSLVQQENLVNASSSFWY
jgi:hypothetical protein